MITGEEVIDFIENQIINDISSDGYIHLNDWEKDVIKEVFDNNKKRVWIFTGRKTGATSLCRWMHWLYVKDPNDEDYTIVIGNTKDYTESCIKKRPIRLHNFRGSDNRFGIKCFKVVSKRTFSILDGNINDIMYDVSNFDINTYKIIDSVNRNFITICLPLKEKIYIEALDLIKEDDVVVMTDEKITLK